MNSAQDGERHPYTVLAGIDFTPRGDQAFHEAAALAARIPSAELHVVHVTRTRDPSPRAQLADELTREREKLTAWVTKEAKGLERMGGRMVWIHVRAGSPSREILQLATDIEADLIAVGGQPRSSFKAFLSTSVAARLVKLAHCPVLVAIPKDYSHDLHSPAIEPPCPACMSARRESAGTVFWCEEHAKRHVHGHTYSYGRRLPLASHDSEIVPTGIDMR